MPVGMQIVGTPSGRSAEVDANGALMANLPMAAGNAGFAKLLDSAGHEINTTENGALSVSIDTPLFFEQVDGAALNTNKWTASTSGMTIAQAAGYITLNNGAATTAGAYAILQTIKYIPMYGHLPMRATFQMRTTVAPQTNMTMEFGIGLVSGTAAPTDGAYFRWSTNADFKAIINNGGEIYSAALAIPTPNDATLFDIVVVEDKVQFYIDDTLVAEVATPTGLSYPTSGGRLPLFFRVYNAGSAPAQAPSLSIGQIIVVQEGSVTNKSWGEILSSMGQGAYQSPIAAFGQTANHANSTSPALATLSNTAAGYTTLGGRFQFAAVAGAATDFALFGFQVPAGYQFYCTGLSISCAVTGVAVLTATLLDWALGLNASAVSLATVEAPPATWAPRRIPLGMQSFAALAAVAQVAPDIVRAFSPPLIVDGGRFLHVILQIPNGAATASLVFRGDVMLQGYFE